MTQGPSRATLSNRVAKNEMRIERLEELIPQMQKVVDAVDFLSNSINGYDVTLMDEKIRTMDKKQDRLILLIDGDDSKDVTGVRKTLKDIQTNVNSVMKDRERLKWILIGVGLTGLINSGVLAVVVRALATVYGQP